MTSLPSIKPDVIDQLATMVESQKAPLSLARLISSARMLSVSDRELSASELLSWLELTSPNDPHKARIATAIARWDAIREGSWTDNSKANTTARRELVHKLLELSADERTRLDRVFPQSPSIPEPVSITNPATWTRWYAESRQKPDFYWSSYRRYLLEQREWEPKSVAALDSATTDVLERLCDPFGAKIHPTKGLVIGYVQSGKTANFTGVIAKAVDAGYRLVIVLAGMQNLLRNQTQRRIDKELLGKEFVEEDYARDDDWNEFVSHNGLPRDQGAVDWVRLTTASRDFKAVSKGLTDLGFKFTVTDAAMPFRSPQNLRAVDPRLIVVKKNKQSLSALITSLGNAAKSSKVPIGEIPTLVIDDESDQASVNAASRAARASTEVSERRSTINGLTVDLLRLLENPQYVGYTATPFANVFIDPDDSTDLFPSDFILSLPRPLHYMGVLDFTDDSAKPKGKPSNHWAHVRVIKSGKGEAASLAQAIDAYVLSGALKVFRSRKGMRFKHHTMLVHSSPLKARHSADAAQVEDLFTRANYLSRQGMERLEQLWNEDFKERCELRADGDPIPASWRDLTDCVSEAHGKVMAAGNPVIVLNGDESDNPPDFDAHPIWRIIVGGAKLSRGYTVEGLTVSYYRRTANATDTLLQMGRWFGFRRHYRDLVRLYIGTDEPRGRSGKRVNIYDQFVAACRDEEEFRSQLERYASLEPEERITPKQVPPLVPSHMLLPTAKNKMFNAVQTFVNYGGDAIERTGVAVTQTGRLANVSLLKELLSGCNLASHELALSSKGATHAFKAVIAVQEAGPVRAFLERFTWEGEKPRDWPLVLEFLSEKHGDPEIDSWALLLPQLRTVGERAFAVHGHRLTIKQRGRVGSRFGVFSEPEHVCVAKWIANQQDGDPRNQETALLGVPKRAAMLLYPVVDRQEAGVVDPPSIGFALYLPKNTIKKKVAFSVRDATRPDDLVVPTKP